MWVSKHCVVLRAEKSTNACRPKKLKIKAKKINSLVLKVPASDLLMCLPIFRLNELNKFLSTLAQYDFLILGSGMFSEKH